MKAAIYVRISRPDEAQILENQRQEAMRHVEERSLELYRIYEDIYSGAREDRPGLNQLRDDARARRFQIVIFTSLSRMTRGGVGAALYILKELESHGIGWHFTQQPILNYDNNTPKLVKDIILAVFAAVDEDYRDRISRATKASISRRRAAGQRWGRPKGSKNKATVKTSKGTEGVK